MSIVLDGTAGVTFPNSTTQAAAAAPGGSTTQLQYNNAGAFGGISGVTTDGTRMTASTTIGVGAATPSTSGVGITFPATQSASTNANTLDDYEEGTWTPADASGAGLSFTSAATASYIKVGRIVTVNCTVNYPTTASGSSAKISGLPFTSHDGIYYGSVRGIGTAITAPVIQIGASSTTIEFFLSGNGGGAVTNVSLSSTSPYASITYITAS